MHLVGLQEYNISYHEKTESAKRESAAKRQQQCLVPSIPTNLTATHGPPDRACHFKTATKKEKPQEVII